MAELIKDEGTGGALVPHKSGGSPFDGEGKSLVVTKPVNAAQLIEEVYDRLGDRQRFQVVLQDSGDGQPYSESNPATLHVFPADVDMRTVRGAVESHVLDAHFGMTDEERGLNDLCARLTTEDLSNEELNRVLRGLLAR